MEYARFSKSQLRANQKANYWRGFWVGIFIGLVPATFLFILLQKLINASL